MEQTKNCVYCFKPAIRWSGYVSRKGVTIIAGWCSKKCEKKGARDGFSGLYKWQMGREEYDA